ncbi:MAG: gas vesicle protein GvpO [Pseudomonadota bacterium]
MTSPARRATPAPLKHQPPSAEQPAIESTFPGTKREGSDASPQEQGVERALGETERAGAASQHSSASERPLDLPRIIEAARDAKAMITNAPIDQIVEARTDEDGWLVRVDVIEERARIGSNDLITSYRLMLDPAGALRGFTRTGKGRREDRVCDGSAG